MALTNGRRGVEEEAGPAGPRSPRRGFRGAGSGPQQPRRRTGFQVGQVDRSVGVGGCHSAGRPGRAAEMKIWPFSPACTSVCRPGAFCVAAGPRPAKVDFFMHVCSHRRWEWISTLKNQCKTSEVEQLSNSS